MATTNVDLEGGQPITRLPANVANRLRHDLSANLRREGGMARPEKMLWRDIDRAKGREKIEIRKDQAYLRFYG